MRHRGEAGFGLFEPPLVELALASYPGLYVTEPPQPERALGGYWPTLVPADLVEAVVVSPSEQVPTEEARQAIPSDVALADAVANISAASELVLGIERSDLGLIARGLTDRLHQPARRSLYQRSLDLVDQARELGAIGATISGAGPSVLLWSYWQDTGKVVESATAAVDGWAEVRRLAFSSMGADVPEL